MSPYGDIIVRHVLHLTAYYYYDHAVLIEYGRKEETVGRHAVEQLRGVGTFVLSWLYEKHIADNRSNDQLFIYFQAADEDQWSTAAMAR